MSYIERMVEKALAKLSEAHHLVFGGEENKVHGIHSTLTAAKKHADKLETKSGRVHVVHTADKQGPGHYVSKQIHYQTDSGWSKDSHDGHFHVKESVEPIEEISKKVLGSYINKAHSDASYAAVNKAHHEKNADDKGHGELTRAHFKKYAGEFKHLEKKRTEGIKRATARLTREAVEIVEERFKKDSWVKHSTNGKVGQVVGVSGDKASVDIKWNYNGKTTSHPMNHDKLEAMKEEVEGQEISEVSKALLGRYISAAHVDKSHHAHEAGRINGYAEKAKGGTTEKERDYRDHHNTMHGVRSKGIERAINKLVAKESVEPVEEISKKTLGSYVKKASDWKQENEPGRREASSFTTPDDHYKKRGSPLSKAEVKSRYDHSYGKRNKGMNQAIDRLTKEEVEQIDELSAATLGSYVGKASKKSYLASTMSKSINDPNKKPDDMHKYVLKRSDGIRKAAGRLMDKKD